MVEEEGEVFVQQNLVTLEFVGCGAWLYSWFKGLVSAVFGS
jgi:hypothetical protein